MKIIRSIWINKYILVITMILIILYLTVRNIMWQSIIVMEPRLHHGNLLIVIINVLWMNLFRKQRIEYQQIDKLNAMQQNTNKTHNKHQLFCLIKVNDLSWNLFGFLVEFVYQMSGLLCSCYDLTVGRHMLSVCRKFWSVSTSCVFVCLSVLSLTQRKTIVDHRSRFCESDPAKNGVGPLVPFLCVCFTHVWKNDGVKFSYQMWSGVGVVVGRFPL